MTYNYGIATNLDSIGPQQDAERACEHGHREEEQLVCGVSGRRSEASGEQRTWLSGKIRKYEPSTGPKHE